MDTALYKAIMNGDQMSFSQLTERLDSSTLQQQQVTHQNKDTVLHIAAKFNRSEIARSIIYLLEPGFLYKKNAKEDTPLHIAARLGSWEMVEVLANFIKEKEQDLELASDEKLLRMVNARKDTALHDAARNGHYKVVELLTEVDPVLAGMTNDDGESPLFLAVEKRHMSIANRLLNVDPLCSFKGRNGMNALHAAVIRSQNQGLKVIHLSRSKHMFINALYKPLLDLSCFMAWLIDRGGENLTIDWEDFIRTLVKKDGSAITETDDCGWTPLHYAAHFGTSEIAKLFLRNNNLVAYARTEGEGMTLLHVATKEGQVSVLETITEHYPEVWDLQDNKGQTPLHTAVISGKLQTVKSILKIPSFHSLANQQDHDGNTALHLAIIGKHHEIFNLLVKNSKVDKTITNKEGLAIFDLALLDQELEFVELNQIKVSLTSKGCLTSLDHVSYKVGGRPKTPKREQIKKFKGEEPENDRKLDGQQPCADSNLESVKEEKPTLFRNAKRSQHLKNIVNAYSVVATLIATVSFTAGFTIPGGYKNDGPSEGMAVLSKKAAFRAFVITNAMAFCFSASSVFLYFQSLMVENHDRLLFFAFRKRFLIRVAISAMVIAFITGTYAMLSDSSSLDAAILAIGCSYYLIGYIALARVSYLKVFLC